MRYVQLLLACAFTSAAFAQSANLVLDSVGPASEPWVGAVFSTTIPVVFSNHGPAPATDVKLTFTIPAGAVFEAVIADRPLTCTTPAVGLSGDVVCTAPSIDPTGNRVTVTVRVEVTRVPGTTQVFTGVLTSSNAQQSPQSASTAIVQPVLTDLALTGVTAPSTAYVGAVYDNVVTIVNHGPAAALQASVGMHISLAYANPPVAPPGWTCTVSSFLHDVSCSTSSFPAGATATFTFPAYSQAAGQATAIISAGCLNPLSAGSGPIATNTTIQMPPPTDLGVSISADPPVVHTRDKQTYTIQITNKGNSPAVWVELTPQLPGKSISNGPTSFFVLDAGSTATSTFVMQADAATAGPLTATATVTAANVSGARTATTTTSCLGPRTDDLQATLTVPTLPVPDSISFSQPAVWTAGVVNNGPDTTNGWEFSLNLEASITKVTSSDPAITCSLDDQRMVRCSGRELANGDSFTVRVTAVPGYFHPTIARAFVFNPDPDPHPENNELDLVTGSVPPNPDLSVALQASSTIVDVGSTDDLTIDVSNLGGVDAWYVTLQVSLPPSFTLVDSDYRCTGTTTLTCTVGFIPSGMDWQPHLKVRANSVGTFNPTATAATTTLPEVRMDNNSGSLAIAVVKPGPKRRGVHH